MRREDEGYVHTTGKSLNRRIRGVVKGAHREEGVLLKSIVAQRYEAIAVMT